MSGGVPAQSNACGKIPFASAEEAHWYTHGRGHGMTTTRVYRCWQCGQWHWTSKSKTDARRHVKAMQRKHTEAAS